MERTTPPLCGCISFAVAPCHSNGGRPLKTLFWSFHVWVPNHKTANTFGCKITSYTCARDKFAQKHNVAFYWMWRLWTKPHYISLWRIHSFRHFIPGTKALDMNLITSHLTLVMRLSFPLTRSTIHNNIESTNIHRLSNETQLSFRFSQRFQRINFMWNVIIQVSLCVKCGMFISILTHRTPRSKLPIPLGLYPSPHKNEKIALADYRTWFLRHYVQTMRHKTGARRLVRTDTANLPPSLSSDLIKPLVSSVRIIIRIMKVIKDLGKEYSREYIRKFWNEFWNTQKPDCLSSAREQLSRFSPCHPPVIQSCSEPCLGVAGPQLMWRTMSTR